MFYAEILDSLDTSQAIPKVEIWHCKYLDGKDKPVGMYKFRYRSLGMYATFRRCALLMDLVESLKSLCIIPRSPSPIPLEDRDPDELTEAEKNELLKRYKVCGDQVLALKLPIITFRRRGEPQSWRRRESRKNSRESARLPNRRVDVDARFRALRPAPQIQSARSI